MWSASTLLSVSPLALATAVLLRIVLPGAVTLTTMSTNRSVATPIAPMLQTTLGAV